MVQKDSQKPAETFLEYLDMASTLVSQIIKFSFTCNICQVYVHDLRSHKQWHAATSTGLAPFNDPTSEPQGLGAIVSVKETLYTKVFQNSQKPSWVSSEEEPSYKTWENLVTLGETTLLYEGLG